MAWHILHGLLEQVRVHSTFPGKLWIIMMFIFRIVIVARIGDMVYHDEQESFVCNTLTPGCRNVCFNGFSPISQLRFWSLMVLIVAVPGIFFFVYASHKIYHAHVKFPEGNQDQDEEEQRRRKWDAGSEVDTYIHPPSVKRKRDANNLPPSFANATAPPLYEVKRLNSSRKGGKGMEMRMREMDGARRRKYKERGGNRDEDKDLMEKRKGSTTDNNYTPTDDLGPRKWIWSDGKMGYPVYTDARGTKVEYVKKPKHYSPEIKGNKEKSLLLENPTLYRAYWWHVAWRTVLEVGFLVGQYYLYGWMVPELYRCERLPCIETVHCYVSRPMEKTCLMWLMYALGGTACLLSIAEFWTLGFKKFKIAVCCAGETVTFEEKRRRLARFNRDDDHSKPSQVMTVGEPAVLHRNGFTVSLDSLSSATTVESV